MEVLFGGNRERRGRVLRFQFPETSGGWSWSFDSERPGDFTEGGEGE